jgi:hypothetical protein
MLNSNMTTKILYHPPLLRERGLKSKTMFLIKKDLNIFKIAVYGSTVMNGSLSPGHGTSSACGWRNGLQYGG